MSTTPVYNQLKISVHKLEKNTSENIWTSEKIYGCQALFLWHLSAGQENLAHGGVLAFCAIIYAIQKYM